MNDTLNSRDEPADGVSDLGIDLRLSDQHRLLVQVARRFVRSEIMPLEETLGPDAVELPSADYERLRKLTDDMGLHQFGVPQKFGGAGLDIVSQTLLVEEFSQHRAGLYLPCYEVFGRPPFAQLYGASDHIKERYLLPTVRGEMHGYIGLTEPDGGSDPARAIKTSAKRDGDDWVINGTKVFASNAQTAAYGMVFARTDPDAGRAGITAFIVDTDAPGFEVRRVIPVLRTGHPPTEIGFDNVRVPHENVLGTVGGGFSVANDAVTRNRVPYSAGCIGVAVAAQRMAIEYAKQRHTFGEALSTRQAIQWMLVDSEIEIRTSRWLTLVAARKADEGIPFRFDAAMAKLQSSESAGRVVDRAIQVYGGYGVSKDLPLERWYRELRIRRIGEGPSEVQRHIVARDILSGDGGEWHL